MYWYQMGKFKKALKVYHNELRAILKIEKTEERRFHKGLHYYQIGLCYMHRKKDEFALDFFKKAYEEDLKSYGKEAKTFLAHKMVKKYQEALGHETNS